MKNIYLLSKSINVIEQFICEKDCQEIAANTCNCSLSYLQKLFRYALNCSVGEYIIKRKITLSAIELLDTKANLLDIALKYGYNSSESFCRAFSRQWGYAPSEFRKTFNSGNLFPKLEIIYQNGGLFMDGKRIHTHEIYDIIKAMQNTYIICFDIISLHPTNLAYGSGAGDLVISESYARIDAHSANNLLLRIGGDEFCLFTSSGDIKVAEEIMNKILSFNGNTITCNSSEIPVNLRAGILKLEDKNLQYSELFSNAISVIDKARQEQS